MFKKITVLALLVIGSLSACSSNTSASATSKFPSNYAEMKAHAQGFTVGDAPVARTVFIYFDTQCPHCSQTWDAMKPFSSKLKVIWVPVGLLNGLSAPQGAVLLASTAPLLSMEAHETSMRANRGGIDTGSVKDADISKIKRNTQLFMDMGFEGVPVMIYADRAGTSHEIVGSKSTAELIKLLEVTP